MKGQKASEQYRSIDFPDVWKVWSIKRFQFDLHSISRLIRNYSSRECSFATRLYFPAHRIIIGNACDLQEANKNGTPAKDFPAGSSELVGRVPLRTYKL